MADTPEFLAERLSEEGEKVSRFFNELSPEQWNIRVYPEDGWTVHQILAHFDVTETNMAWLIKDVLNGGGGAPEDFDLDEFNKRTVASWEGLPAEDLLNRFQTHRQRTIELVKSMSEADLQKIGRHPFFGVAPMLDVIKLIYRHNQIHIREIRRALS